MTDFLSKICLGTAQFGLDYGLNNENGVISSTEIEKILKEVYSQNIHTLDTSPEYGHAETIIGSTLEKNDISFNIMSKSYKFTQDTGSYDIFIKKFNLQLHNTLSSLKQTQIDTYYIRNLDALIECYDNKVINHLTKIKNKGLVKKIGVSVYDRVQIDNILEHFKPDVIQIPFSMLDQRLLLDNTLSKLTDLGIEIHVRSVFTQGLAFVPPEELDPFFTPISKHIAHMRNTLKEKGMTPLEAALSFVLQRPEITKIILGVASLNQIIQNISCIKNLFPPKLEWKEFAIHDPLYLDPRNWTLNT